ncbi:MAG: NAD(P)/FAD-dependent oxidoreductase [Spirochaetes bacterium]|nr:NAD(P)/FAD-dependent oxidoreductase [Spirochaetota bacterium]
MTIVPNYKAIIIGAGSAGLFAAIRLAETAGKGILLLERGEKPCRKLLLTGSGQCNITHAGKIADFPARYGGGARHESAGRFLKPALYGFTNEDLLSWFRAQGVKFETEENGKVFPADRRASSILKVLQTEAERLGVRIETNRRVCGIERLPEGFLIRAEGLKAGVLENVEYHGAAVLIATGGASYPRTGSSGDGYALAALLGHHIVPPKAALAPVFVKDFALICLAGLSFRNAGLTIRRGNAKKLEMEGDLLITHEGLSGPLILDASRHIDVGDLLEIRFANAAIEEFRARLDAALKSNPHRLVRTVLADSGLTRSMAERFCDLACIGQEETAAAVPRAKRETLCRLACAHPFEVEKLGSMDAAMVTAGGIDLSEVNARTMESRLVPGLFFAGEVLDIDGDSGGYNLQAAFSTGALAARGMLFALAR